jgi:hypothetical protein
MEGLRPGTTIAPPLAGSATIRSHRDAVVHVLLSGFAGPVAGKTYDSQMVPMNTNDDEWIAAVSSYVRNAFGNHGAVVKPGDVKRLRAAATAAQPPVPWTAETLNKALPAPIPRTGWKVTASENLADAALLFDGKPETRWKTEAMQKTGQWLQVELPAETLISAVRFDQWKAQGDHPKSARIEGSLDGKKWNTLAEGNGLPGLSEFYFPAAKVKFVKATVTKNQRDKPWSVFEFEIIAGK